MQTYENFEIIITDDSPDSQLEAIIAETNLPGVRYVRNAAPLGSPQNWNAALDLASGQYIKIMHHDDWFTRETSLQEFVNLLEENPDATIAFSGSLNIAKKRRWVHTIGAVQAQALKASPALLFEGNIIGAPSATIVRRSNTRYDKNLKWLVDLDYYMTILAEENNFAYTTKPLVSIGISESQITNQCIDDGPLNLREYLHVYQKHSLHRHAAARAVLIQTAQKFGAGYGYLRAAGFATSQVSGILARRIFVKVGRLSKKLGRYGLTLSVQPLYRILRRSCHHVIYNLLQLVGLKGKGCIATNSPYPIFFKALPPRERTFFVVDSPGNFGRIGWRNIYVQLEPEAVIPQEKFILSNSRNYEYLLANSTLLLQATPNSRRMLFGTAWISAAEYYSIDIDVKQPQVSFVEGGKAIGEGHLFRQEVFHRQDEIPQLRVFRSSREAHLDNPYSNELLPPDTKMPLFKHFQYSLVIENVRQDNWFTEKLIDCLLTQTIPVYFGAPNIGEFFNISGWLILSDLPSVEELIGLLAQATGENYRRHATAIGKNANRAREYCSLAQSLNRSLASIDSY